MLIINYRPITHSHRNFTKLLVLYNLFFRVISSWRRYSLLKCMNFFRPRKPLFHAYRSRGLFLQVIYRWVPCRTRRIVFSLNYYVLIVHNCAEFLPGFAEIAFSFCFLFFELFFVWILTRWRYEVFQLCLTFKPLLLSCIAKAKTFLEFFLFNFF